MARSNRLVTLEVTNSTKEIGQLYPARRVHSTIDTGGIVQWIVDHDVLCFEINGVEPEVDRLYKARKARTRTGLVNSKPVYMIEYCCGLIDDQEYWATCAEFMSGSHSVTLDYMTCSYPDPTVVTFRTATFTISPDGSGTVTGRGYWAYPWETSEGFVTRKDYFRVAASCLTLDPDGSGPVEGIRWRLEEDGTQYGDGPIVDLSSSEYESWTPVNANVDIYGTSGSYCSGDYYWNLSSPYRLRA